ncbi:MAG: 4a-hydroxytetrahydrobiopterin dehydratase [Phycisphaerales bacterium]|nr:4a-hydroxytetrahydrobiopterin dehydratase [Phycisphaerales bacterium]
MDRIDPEKVQAQVEVMTEWALNGEALQRTLSFADFQLAMDFVKKVAALAEQQQHHPDIMIRYNKVTLTVTTHDAGGLTDRDFRLAKSVDEITLQS